MRLLAYAAASQFPLICVAWTLSLFAWPSTKDGAVSLYPGSPKEADPEAMRVKRQAYQVYMGGDVSVTIDKSGQAETGDWGEWTHERQCSRTCGGGVYIEKRVCSGECTGPSVRYVSCNVEDCPAGAEDFRTEQCARQNDMPLDGNYYHWLPYPGKNKCELTCKPDNANFYYKWADKVIDGTPCDKGSDDICVDGICLPIGCDKKLGSALKDDKCAVCGGDGSTCKTVEGFFDERNLSPGYHNIIRLPVGATSIRVEEMRPTTNSLAIKNASDFFYLNGNYQIQVVDRPLEIGGTVFDYDSHKSLGHAFEKLSAKGPINEELTIALLFQTGNRDSAIKYEFSVPLELDIPYQYRPAEWSSCSVTCGKGVQTRTPFCVDNKSQQRVADELCEESNATKPEIERPCETVDCSAEWYEGPWEPCSTTCGETGAQYRVVYCHKVFSDGKRMTVDDSNCTSERPPVQQSCNRFSCPEWQAGPWSACSEKCGDAFQYRSVTCRSAKDGEEGRLLAADACTEEQPETQRNCNLGPCEGLSFFTSDWKLCEKCNETEETRNVTCKDKTGRAYVLEKCLNDNATEIPIDTRSCATPAPCIYEWHSSEWSKCSTDCGHGHNTRRVVCAIHQLGELTVVDEGHCNSETKPEIRQNCTNEEKCNGTYYTGPWTKCSAECGGGTQSRMIVCLNYDKKPVPEWCDEAEKPAEEQDCNTEACPTCEDSEFGCCPDNSTFALGPYLEGCSNCSISKFGCCADNVTDATGPNGEGCIEFVEMEAGSGEEKEEKEDKEKEETCEVTNEETGESVSVVCKKFNETIADEMETFENITAENVTLHCSKSEFGCCPDWTTFAEGKNNEGCPVFVQGACNETANGCCPDNVTMARGPNLEGCGDPSCAASLYGCCKDRKTIAFGPHYAGCERSSFPCEISPFGCCPDGETAALGKNGTGCGANCLVTKYGCCPDGVTVSKGLQNEGCGCEYGQFGCCPDGKTAAKGAGYYGCPESCTQSQYGCCPDGKTPARGAFKEGCPCQYTRYGCCPDGETTALGPRNEGCDDCRYARHGCCPDGETRASGPNYAGCPVTTLAPFLFGGTVAPEKIVSCALPQDQGSVCHPGYKLVWYYDSAEGRCSQFWYGGCEGNDNRFATKEQCETICVDTPGVGRCYLPKVEGPMRCNQLSARYWYDYTTKQCGAFWWRGCLGNANNFGSWEECQSFCAGVGPFNVPTTPPPPSHVTPYRLEVPSMPPQRISEPEPQRTPEEPQQIAPEAILQHQPAGPEQRPIPSMDEICRQTVDSGPCSSYEDLFYYDPFSGKCNPFVYGGCGGNMNKFKTKEECEARCGHLSIVDQNARTRDACNERMDVGRCQGSFESWYYEKATGMCEKFIYSGCGGTANRFHTLEQCKEVCMRPAVITPPLIGHAAAGRVPNPPFQHQLPTHSTEGPSQAAAICEQAKDTGPCDKYVTKWYYNKMDGTCNRFHYGGCEGTANRFDSEQQCKLTCGNFVDACSLPRISGPCSGKHLRFYFDLSTRTCDRFEYGGCLGNSNNFMSLEECEKRCGAPTSPELQSLILPYGAGIPGRCLFPKQVGRCKAAFEKFYYDARLGLCTIFTYGGCEGNENRFDSVEECRATCGEKRQHETLQMHDELPNEVPELGNEISEEDGYRHRDRYRVDSEYEDKGTVLIAPKVNEEPYAKRTEHQQPLLTSLPELCLLPEDVGPCYGEIVRWRYDSETSSCTTFSYTGCGQNANSFTSEEACERACGPFRNEDVCSMAVDVGSCTLGLTKWFYNEASGECHVFMYSGCGGNGNRFSTKAECEHLCTSEAKAKAKGTVDVCILERDSGPCTDPVTQWYFHSSDGECRQFTYGGCRGNGNRFDTKEQCVKQCAPHSQDLIAVDIQKVCSLPFEAGPCRQARQAWYYDRSQSRCRRFVYGGCEGNGNRFDTENECMAICSSVAPTSSSATRASVSVLSAINLTVGAEIQLACDPNGRESPMRWFKDSETLDLEVQDDSRMQIAESGRRLSILDARETDSGEYSCAAEGDIVSSEPVKITVHEKQTEDCDDRGTQMTCQLIIKVGLCSSQRYGTFCCRSCREQGFRVLPGPTRFRRSRKHRTFV